MAGIKSLRKLETDDPKLGKVQEYTQRSIDPIAKSEIINGTLLKKVKLTAGKDNNIDHKLGRKPQGWVLVRVRASATIWDLQDANTLSKSTLRLWTSADVTVDLWVF